MYISQRSDFAHLEELDRVLQYFTCPKFDETLDDLEAILQKYKNKETSEPCEECDGNPCYSHCLRYA